jgi:hypothetical protein
LRPLEVASHLASSCPRRFQGGNMPLSFSAEEMDLLLSLAAPID